MTYMLPSAVTAGQQSTDTACHMTEAQTHLWLQIYDTHKTKQNQPNLLCSPFLLQMKVIFHQKNH